jgi:excisionase family DNA binding protein
MEKAIATARPAGYSIPDAAAQLSVSRSHLYQLIDRGLIRRVKIGARSVIPASEIDRLIEDGTQ